MNDIQDRIGTWGNKQFPDGTPDSLTAKFAKEAIEFCDDQTPGEAADCAILLFHHAHRCGYNLLEEVERKFAINQKRTWGKPDEQGVVEHV